MWHMMRLHIKENYVSYRYLTENYGKDARVTAIVDTTEVLLLEIFFPSYYPKIRGAVKNVLADFFR